MGLERKSDEEASNKGVFLLRCIVRNAFFTYHCHVCEYGSHCCIHLVIMRQDIAST
jgi:hypothetical protein